MTTTLGPLALIVGGIVAGELLRHLDQLRETALNPYHDARGRFATSPGAAAAAAVAAPRRRRRATAPAAPPPPPPIHETVKAHAARTGVTAPPPARGDNGPRLLAPSVAPLEHAPSVNQLHDGLYNGLQVRIEREHDAAGLRADDRARITTPLRDTTSPRKARSRATPMKGR